MRTNSINSPPSIDTLRFSLDSLNEFGLSPISRDSLDSSKTSRISLLSNAIRVTPQIFPSVSEVFTSTISKLNIQDTIECFVSAHHEINAFCVPLKEDVRAALLLTSRIVELLNEKELVFVIGHEIGHYVFNHFLYPPPNVASEINTLRALNILELNKASEISADRIGFICSDSIEDVIRCKLKMASGLPDKYMRFDVSSYLDQLREIKSLGGSKEELYRTHPMFSLRARAIMWFSMSQLYFDFKRTDKPAPINRDTLEKMICSDLLSVSGLHKDEIKNAVFRTAKLWATLSMFAVDRKFTKDEQALLVRVFGEEDSEKAIRFTKDHGKNAPAAIDEKLNEALKSAINLPVSDRSKLISDLEKIVSSYGGMNMIVNEKLSDIAKNLNINRNIYI